ncbi:MAG: SprT-like domain-containing protein [Chthoniobacteraceae bacterium]
MATKKRKVAHAKLPLQRQFAFPDQGRHFNLREVFDKLNTLYFRKRLKGYRIEWGRKRHERPAIEIVFATIQEEDRLIRIHPLLDRAFIPRWFLEYVMYHEMCHAVVRDRYSPAGKRIIHHDEFYEKERKFRWFKRAKRWEHENLGRFLR